MIGERIIREALTPERKEPARSDLVPVRGYVRKPPVNPKRQALHEALRRAVAS
jgi:hypothetical protein